MSPSFSPKLVVAEAWEMTKRNKRELFWYGFTPAFFGMVVGTVYVLYQAAAFRHFLLSEKDTINYTELLHSAWGFLLADGTPTGLLITLIIILLAGYFTVPVLCKSSLVFLLSKIHKGEEPEKGVQAGFLNFLSMFEFGAIKNAASPGTFLTEGSFVLRNLGAGMFQLLMPVFIIFAFFGLIALFFFAYVPQILVLQKGSLMGSVAKSAKLSFTYFSETIRLFLLILLIELRVLLNIAIILFLPVTVVAITGLFTATWLQGVGMVLAGIVVVSLLSLAATISGTLEIFSTAIWTIAFHTLTPEEEKVTNL